jgi:hypothetical protein
VRRGGGGTASIVGNGWAMSEAREGGAVEAIVQ